jgi:predicted DNA-binding transcriptional regulator YafY
MEIFLSNLHRIQWIDNEIRSNKFPNSRTIMLKFEISQRQALRDIEYLRYSMNAPLEFSHEKNGYYYTDRSFVVPNLLITDNEQKILAYLAEKYKSVNNRTSAEIGKLFDRLSNLKNEQFKMFKPDDNKGQIENLPLYDVDPGEVKHYSIIKEAIENNVKIRIEYLNQDHIKSIRMIHPYKMINRDSFVYLAAYCELKNHTRLFRCDRIKSIFTSPDKFDCPESAIIDNYILNYAFNFRKPYVAEIEFEKDIYLDHLKRTFKIKIIDINEKKYHIDFFSSEDIISSLMLIKNDFKIISPVWLKEKLKEKLLKIIEKNEC